ncbi:MAG: hypothetical protein HDT20_00375 [Oscillibacter sp.]|nr:hypothetical protein [Oscillibacter sp.]
MSKATPLTPEKIRSIQEAAERLIELHRSGALGGEIMPEDANPGLDRDAEENFLYFTLPMALNYQRNSYRLWEAAQKTYLDAETSDVFVSQAVLNMGIDCLRERLLKYKVAVQPNRHPEIWMRLCETFQGFDGSVKTFFAARGYSVANIKQYMTEHKKMFPYLSGAKIMNYWLYVMEQYTGAQFTDRSNITVAPDTHVLQASARLGLIKPEEINSPNIRETVSGLWDQVFAGTDRCAIDVHTPLWLWSRNGFSVDIEAK